MTVDLDSRVVKQLEYYFGDKNLPQDKFMLREISENDGWMNIETLLKFNRLAKIQPEASLIALAVSNSKSDLISVNEDNTKIRRNPDKPIPEVNDESKAKANAKMCYIKGVPMTATLDQAEEFFGKYGPLAWVKMRKDENSQFKGSCFVEFSNEADANKFCESKNVKFNEEATEELSIMKRSDYFASKNQNKKDEKNKARAEQLGIPDKENGSTAEIVLEPYENGRVVKITGLEGVETTREEMKELFKDQECNWVTYNKQDPMAYIRLGKDAKEALEAVMVEGKITLGEKQHEPVVIEGEEEVQYWKDAQQQKADFFNRRNNKRPAGGRGGRGGGRGRGSFRNKRQRTD